MSAFNPSDETNTINRFWSGREACYYTSSCLPGYKPAEPVSPYLNYSNQQTIGIIGLFGILFLFVIFLIFAI
jgi:hypothetical protein